MFEKTTTVLNKNGIHCRPASAILMAVMDYSQDHKIEVVCERGSAGLESLLELMSLGLLQGDGVTIKVEGPREGELGARLVELFSHEYDFPPRE